MKLVTAVVEPHTWEAVRSAVESLGVTGMTVNEASQRAAGEAALAAGLRVEIVVEDAEADSVVDTVVDAVGRRSADPSGRERPGPPHVWVVPVQRVVRVRADPPR